ncbi:hypothetical protein WICMUC_000344 [Wickerhamomyces mucosus]|uniref:tRNA-binding domain-containing protein n=1 Tax=Wickerhamomyces mucosus TaxID=1378264 RepID=A0A9P8PXR2_9ASCO|nr:hypothetical protein WICMUC_000344 [Wickerhamomyces mucosus]
MFKILRRRTVFSRTVTPTALSLKVGFIKECRKHPDADKLYVSKIITSPELINASELTDTSQYLTVCSGLANHVPIEEMINRKIVLLTNLKASKMRGIKSEAMVLAAEIKSSEGSTEVEIVNAPKSSALGERLFFKPFLYDKEPTKLKSKVWEDLQANLFTNNEGVVIYRSEGEDHELSSENSNDTAFVNRLVNAKVR